MVDAGCAQGVVGCRADEAALAGDESCGDGAGLAAITVCDPPGQDIAGIVQGCGEAQGQGRSCTGCTVIVPTRDPTAPIPWK